MLSRTLAAARGMNIELPIQGLDYLSHFVDECIMARHPGG